MTPDGVRLAVALTDLGEPDRDRIVEAVFTAEIRHRALQRANA